MIAGGAGGWGGQLGLGERGGSGCCWHISEHQAFELKAHAIKAEISVSECEVNAGAAHLARLKQQPEDFLLSARVDKTNEFKFTMTMNIISSLVIC